MNMNPINTMAEQLLGRLEQDEGGWKVQLPDELGLFLGKNLSLCITTLGLWEDGDVPPPSKEELSLAQTILANLKPVLKESETQFTKYNIKHDPDAQSHICDPHIWLWRDTLNMNGTNSRWIFVILRDDEPDFGYHIEFDGTQFQEICAGD